MRGVKSGRDCTRFSGRKLREKLERNEDFFFDADVRTSLVYTTRRRERVFVDAARRRERGTSTRLLDAARRRSPLSLVFAPFGRFWDGMQIGGWQNLSRS